MKPSQYAAAMNISSVYLYGAVKQTTGVSVSESIRNEIVLQAKRLLFYTDKSVKEIALELGNEDYAYFTRLFTKVSKQSLRNSESNTSNSPSYSFLSPFPAIHLSCYFAYCNNQHRRYAKQEDESKQ